MNVVTKTTQFKGKEFKFCCYDGPAADFHPSWWSHVDEAEVRERDWNIQKGDLVLDIGAAYGSYTLTALALGASHVWAWSPQGGPGEISERDFLQLSLEANGPDWVNRVTFMDGGLYDRSGVLHADTQEFLTHKQACDRRIDLKDNAWLSVCSLDSYITKTGSGELIGGQFAHLDYCDYTGNSNIKVWFKLDVEGAEAIVLEGSAEFMKRLANRNKEMLLQIENHNFKNKHIEVDVAKTLGRIEGYMHSYTKFELQHSVPHHSVSHSLWHAKRR